VSGSYLFVTWDGSGNLMPTLAAALSLHERGHSVRFVGHANQHERIAFPFRAWETVPNLYERAPVPPDDVWWDELFLGAAAGRELDVQLQREPVDVAVIDCLLWGALAAVERARVPAAVFVHTIYGRRFAAEDRPHRRERLNSTRALFGLGPVVSLVDAWHRLQLVLVASARCFDRPPEPLPENTVYCGPLRLPTQLQSDLPWQPDVVVSFSTASVLVPRLMQRVLEALGSLPVRSAVSSNVPGLAPAGNTVVRDWIAHDLVLPGARLVITHGGHGSVLAALLHGVPVLCLPLVADQPFVSQRVVDHGAGIALPPSASVSEIRAAVEALLWEERFTAAARVLAEEIARELAADAHVKALEALLP
jgi:UDP:flavonoid glycosyltransferase YjiC (YdhE family)